jgi:hypothetical protein
MKQTNSRVLQLDWTTDLNVESTGLADNVDVVIASGKDAF